MRRGAGRRALGHGGRALARAAFVSGLAAFAFPLAAQSPEPRDPHTAQPERPTLATHAGTVAPGWLEIETGVERDCASGETTLLAPTTLKLGLATRVQLGVAGGYVRHESSPGASAVGGVADLTVDVKWRVREGSGVLGDFAIEPAIKAPLGSVRRGTGTGTTDESLLLISSHDLSGVALDINAGVTRRSGDGSAAPRTASLWTISLGLPAGGALGWAAEIFGYPGTPGAAGEAPIVGALTGPTWTIRRWLVVDAGVIARVHGPQPRALYAGATWNAGRAW
jgi:hypothetical protein